jgi:anthranilate synthase/aminodeoxychorismate synthase-like glutamine amidotransferase
VDFSSTEAGVDRRVVVVDHHDSYTWNLAHLIATVTGVLPTVVESDEIAASALAAYSHVVLSPGPGHPDEYDWSVLDLGVPVLGVCLGMQGLVTHLGGSVERGVPAHGDVAVVSHDGRGVFAGVPSPLRAVRYHSLVAVDVPRALEVTARTEDGTAMGVRHRELPLAGVQFHPESILSEHGAAIVANFLAGVR